jgi:hypothetical protein
MQEDLVTLTRVEAFFIFLIVVVVGTILVLLCEKWYFDKRRAPLDARKDFAKIMEKLGYRYPMDAFWVAETTRTVEDAMYDEFDGYVNELKSYGENFFRRDEK